MTSELSTWPRLDYAAERGTYGTCHAIMQLLGKLPTRLLPWIPHSWHVAFRIDPRGYLSRPMPAGDARSFTVALDVRDTAVVVSCSDGARYSTGISGKSIAELRRDLGGVLAEAGLPAPLHGGPNEVPDPVLFYLDTKPREWDVDTATRLHEAFARADRVFTRFRSIYLGKSSPSHFFWGSFDLAVTRFSGRRAPPHPGGFPTLPDEVTRDAYSHEAISAGMWPGGGGVDEAAFYAYAYPSPDGLSETSVEPEGAYWHGDLGEFVLPYRIVAGSADPDATLIEFLQSTYDAAARLLDWPEDLVLSEVSYGKPVQQIGAG
ncbi:DUF5996 family protein [Aurantiacibacter poecillastricola]|uniref:DUF5996 family protein n=1 Tax=Aurantiacibacter poecillastricola TaxID=3064385 RepID=UPI00273E24D3|nr:DUF5996 family protein [Aurantiacibacter sp. 219JJ12-13]MDP5261548.1 DUF5996 family protein [Aurantiacibacter sp. 219JJ12-13]